MLQNCKTGVRLAFGIIVALMILVGGAIKDITPLNHPIDLLVHDRKVKVEDANIMIDNLNVLARVLRNLVIDENKEQQNDEIRRIADARKKTGELFEYLEKTVSDEKAVAYSGKSPEPGQGIYAPPKPIWN